MSFTPYRSVAVAATFSPRFHQVLSEAKRIRHRFDAQLTLIHVGPHSAETEQKFRDAIRELELPSDANVHYEIGDPAESILAAARKLKTDLLVAGALEKEAVHRQFLGNVARRLVREANCSVMLFTHPELQPKPFRHVVFIAEYSEHAQKALQRALHLAEQEKCEHFHVIRSYTSFDKARAARRSQTGKAHDRTLEEEERALHKFVLEAGESKVPVETRCIRGNTGFALSNFVQAVDADLLVLPVRSKSEAKLKLPAQIEWVTDVIPCNLWVIR